MRAIVDRHLAFTEGIVITSSEANSPDPGISPQRGNEVADLNLEGEAPVHESGKNVSERPGSPCSDSRS